MKYLYAVIEGTTMPWHQDGRRIYGISYEDLSLVVCDTEKVKFPVIEEEVLHHAKVLERLMDDHDILPVSYGTILPMEESVAGFLKQKYDNFKKNLKNLAGSIEMGVRIISNEAAGTDNQQPDKSSGWNYLQNKLGKWKEEKMVVEAYTQLAEEIHQDLLPLAREGKLTVKKGNMFFNGAYLVKRDYKENFEKKCEELGNRYPQLSFLVTGPWPPHNFVVN